jgi:HTH-type transcriptional regulator/antitoxin HigA
VRIISRKTLREFWDRHPEAQQALQAQTMNIRPIKNETDYQAALTEIERLFEAMPGTPESDRLEVLTTLVEAYEERKYNIPLPDPIEAIKYYMENRSLAPNELEHHIGNNATVDEVLNRKCVLTIDMIRRLHAGLGISADVLIQPYAIAA